MAYQGRTDQVSLFLWDEKKFSETNARCAKSYAKWNRYVLHTRPACTGVSNELVEFLGVGSAARLFFRSGGARCAFPSWLLHQNETLYVIKYFHVQVQVRVRSSP